MLNLFSNTSKSFSGLCNISFFLLEIRFLDSPIDLGGDMCTHFGLFVDPLLALQ